MSGTIEKNSSFSGVLDFKRGIGLSDECGLTGFTFLNVELFSVAEK